MIMFLVGFVIGAFAGMLIAALLFINGRDE